MGPAPGIPCGTLVGPLVGASLVGPLVGPCRGSLRGPSCGTPRDRFVGLPRGAPRGTVCGTSHGTPSWDPLWDPFARFTVGPFRGTPGGNLSWDLTLVGPLSDLPVGPLLGRPHVGPLVGNLVGTFLRLPRGWWGLLEIPWDPLWDPSRHSRGAVATIERSATSKPSRCVPSLPPPHAPTNVPSAPPSNG